MKALLLLTLVFLATDFFGEPFRKGGAEEISDPSSDSFAVGRHATFHRSLKRHFRAHFSPQGLEEFRNSVKGRTSREKVSIPETFDARDRWPECVTIKEVQSQGKGRLCWAYATVAVMNDRTCIKSDGFNTFRYSLEDVVSCCPNCTGNTGAVFYFWKKCGFVSEDCKPLDSSRPPFSCSDAPWCNKTCHPKSRKNYDDDKRKASRWYNVSAKGMQMEIMKNGPFVASMEVYDDLNNHTTGVYRHARTTRKKLGNHSVRIIGWGKEGNKNYWLVANSWGEEKHEKGVFKILRGANECGIESNVWAGLPE